MRHIAIFGGTFDPIHNGHIQTSITIQSHFNFNNYYFLPCKIPSIKPVPAATDEQRIEMVRLAINNYPDFSIDLREMKRNGTSYMVNTLASYRKEYPKNSITLIIGYDSLHSLPQWHQWEKIITLTNLLVINRDNYLSIPIPEAVKQMIQKHKAEEYLTLLQQEKGAIFFFNAGTYSISSTQIRQALKKGIEIKEQVPLSVINYIKQQGLYR